MMPPYLEYRSHEQIRDPAVGGRGGLAILLIVALAIGFLIGGGM